MPESLEDFLMSQSPTAERPLLGQTVLIVEDSRFASEALRLICQRSGARIRRADSLAAADRHLRMYRPGIVLVDMGLPDGSGLDLIRRLAKNEPPIECIVAMSADDSYDRDDIIAAGACDFIVKPITSVVSFQKRILSQLPAEARPIEIRSNGDDTVAPDRLGLRDDLSLAADLLEPSLDDKLLEYVTGFLIGVARSAEDNDLCLAVDKVSEARQSGVEVLNTNVAKLKKLLAERLSEEQLV